LIHSHSVVITKTRSWKRY